MARPIPVLPDVPSMMVPPGFSSPLRSASSIILTAIRSLIELPGLNVSSLTTTVLSLTPRLMRLMRTIGVLPMVSRMLLEIFVQGRIATSASLLEDEVCRAQETQTGPEVIPVQRLAHVEQRESGDHRER